MLAGRRRLFTGTSPPSRRCTTHIRHSRSYATNPAPGLKPRNDVSVLIVGDTIEALSCALSFKEKFGVQPSMLPSSRPEETVDKGLVIPINGSRIYKKLNIVQDIEDKGVVLHKYVKLSSSGSTYGEINFKQLSSFHKSSCIAISKSNLSKVLTNALQETPSVKFLRNTSLKSIKNSTTSGNLSAECVLSISNLQNPSKPNLTTKFYDFVIGADGTFSQVCDLVWAPTEMTQTVYMGMYQTIIPKPSQFPNAFMEIWGEQNVMGAYPISNKELAVYTTFNPKSDTDPNDPHSFSTEVPSKEMFSRLSSWSIFSTSPWKEIVGLVSERPTVQLKYPIERNLSSPPVYHHIGLIGSAAYGTYPLMRGHDLALALEDGFTIAECITHPGLGLDIALRKFATLRSPRWEQVKQSSFSTTMAAHAQTQDFRMKLKNFMYKWVNSTTQLTDRESILIGTETIKKSIQILKESDDNKQQ